MKINYILILFSVFASRCKMTTKGFKVKLSESTLPFAGQVMINVDGNWTSICDDGWNKINALVVCRQLDFSGAEAAISGNAFGAAPGPIAAKKFYCNGNETSLSECQSSFNTSTSCNNKTVASVLCIPPDGKNGMCIPPDDFLLLFRIIMTFAIGCLAITSIIILVLTCKTMPLRRQNEKHRNSRSLIAKSSEIGLSNLNTEDIIENSSKREDETLASVFSGSDLSFPCSTLPDTELMATSDERARCVDGNEGQIASPFTDAELIVPCNKDDVQHLDESERKLAKHSESKKRKYMQLKRGSKALIHFYTKLLVKNRNWQLPTDVDRPNDYYSTGQTWADESAGAHQNITDEDSDSKEEYHEICSDSEEKKDSEDKSAFEYVPMLSLSQMLYKGASVELETPAQDEYLDIFPPTDLQMANSSGKRESDYLNPVETNLPSFPKNFGDEASGSYDEGLPEPPKECEMLPTEREDERNGIPLSSVGLDSRECRCEKDLVCTKCLKNPSITINSEIKPKDKGKDVREQESDEDFEYMRMGEYDIKSDNTDVRTEVTRNSEGYAIPLKKYKKANMKDHHDFSEELNKRLLKQNAPSKLHGSVDKRLVPNESDAYDSMLESRRVKVTIHENGTKCLSSPQNRRKIKENEKPSNKTSSHFDKQESTLCEKDSFSECKKLFENKTTKDKEEKGKTFPRAVLSKSSSNSKEDKLHFKTDGDEVGKSRSESCPAESSTSVSPNPSFLKSLESALKLANDPRSKAGTEKKSCTSEFVRDKEKKHVNIEMENSYELDYEDIRSPTDSEYENNDIYSKDGEGSFSGPMSTSDEFEYDYVNNEKQRKSLHLYEAVSKNSELDEDDYENI